MEISASRQPGIRSSAHEHELVAAVQSEVPVLRAPLRIASASRERERSGVDGSFVAEGDVAAFAIAAVRNPEAANSTIVIGGPEPVTLLEVVQAYKLPARHAAPSGGCRLGKSLPGVPDLVSQLATSLETFDSAIAMEETARVYGVPLTSVAAFARARVATNHAGVAGHQA